eukprot:m51a1_g7814 hypothetical protein (205) ;mRNA; f:121043-121757
MSNKRSRSGRTTVITLETFDLDMSPEVNEWDKYCNKHGPKDLPFNRYINNEVRKLEYDEEGPFEYMMHMDHKHIRAGDDDEDGSSDSNSDVDKKDDIGYRDWAWATWEACHSKPPVLPPVIKQFGPVANVAAPDVNAMVDQWWILRTVILLSGVLDPLNRWRLGMSLRVQVDHELLLWLLHVWGLLHAKLTLLDNARRRMLAAT